MRRLTRVYMRNMNLIQCLEFNSNLPYIIDLNESTCRILVEFYYYDVY